MKKILAASLICSLLLASSFLEPALATASDGVGAPTPSSGGIPSLDQFCGNKCGVRCSAAGVEDRCLKYCGICCRECKCVPSGTYGNRHECACYRDKLSSKGKPKCP